MAAENPNYQPEEKFEESQKIGRAAEPGDLTSEFKGIRIIDFGRDEAGDLVTFNADNPPSYTTEEVVLLGDGNFKKGVSKLSLGYYKSDTGKQARTKRLFNDEIEQIKKKFSPRKEK